MRRPLLLLFVALLTATACADCYSHDGISALDSKFYTGPELVSCGNGTNNCCLSDQKCGSNLLCVNHAGDVFREYCSDKDWSGCSSLCPQSKAAGLSLLDCGNNLFCCNARSNGTCCSTQGQHFFVDPDTGDVKDPSKASATTSGTWWEVDSTSLLASTSTSSSGEVATTTERPAASSTSASSDLNDNKGGGKLSAGAAAGIGIGAVVGIAAVVTGAWFLLRKMKKSDALKGSAQEHNCTPSAQDGQNGWRVEAPSASEVRELAGAPRHEMG